jgi:hypothetical protein
MLKRPVSSYPPEARFAAESALGPQHDTLRAGLAAEIRRLTGRTGDTA